MKCPVCGINHRKIRVASVCCNRINNEMIHYIISCSGMPGGTTEENLKSYKKNGIDFNLNHFRKVKKLTEQMDEYMKKFEK